MSRHRSYVFTLNNYTHEEVDHILDMYAKYFCFGYEEGEKGTPHLQGYVQFANPISYTRARVEIGMRAYVEVAKGNFQQNIDYCSKGGEFYEFGDKPSTTAKWEQIEEVMKDPTSNPHMYFMYRSTYEKIKQHQIKQDKKKTEFYCIDPIHDLTQEVIEYFNLEEDADIAYVTTLAELNAYDNPSIVIYDPDPLDINNKLINMYPRGVPINVKNGYQWNTFKPDKFILRTRERQFYPLYKNI